MGLLKFVKSRGLALMLRRITMDSEQERRELYKVIWDLANKLRGSVDGWDFKQYVLGMLFYKYISESFEDYVNKGEWRAGTKKFKYSKEKDSEWDKEDMKSDLVKSQGFFLLPSQLFDRVIKDALIKKKTGEDNNLNETLDKVFKSIEHADGSGESWFKGLFRDIDLNSSKLGETVIKRNDKLLEIMQTIQNMTLSKQGKKAEIDIFGDAYEFLMGMYASNAGKSGGEFYTPPEVSELLVRLARHGKKNLKSLYDPACGSGSLLLKYIKVFGKNDCASLSGQEVNLTTYNLCKMNMILHDMNYENVSIKLGDTLTSPQHLSEKFDAIVSNPPYSTKWKGSDNPMLINDKRFSSAGVLAPKSKADWAFIMHSFYHLKSDGKAVIICFPGVMYRNGAENKIRSYFVKNGFIDAVIQLPENFFYGTSISTCVLIIKRGNSKKDVFFLNAENQFEKIKNRNRLSTENINWIMKKYRERKDEPFVSRRVSIDEIEGQDFNLSVSAYVEKEDTREPINIVELNDQINESVRVIDDLRKGIDETIKELEENGDFFKSSS